MEPMLSLRFQKASWMVLRSISSSSQAFLPRTVSCHWVGVEHPRAKQLGVGTLTWHSPVTHTELLTVPQCMSLTKHVARCQTVTLEPEPTVPESHTASLSLISLCVSYQVCGPHSVPPCSNPMICGNAHVCNSPLPYHERSFLPKSLIRSFFRRTFFYVRHSSEMSWNLTFHHLDG